MKITLLTGGHPRHLYFADQLSKISSDIFWIIEKREDFIPMPDSNIDVSLQKLYKVHFEKRKNSEYLFFSSKAGELAKSIIKNIASITKEDLSNGELKKIISTNKVDVLITYGCHLIPNDVLDLIKLYKWNLHGGLSPWYRGSATHFWPSYLLEPEFTGMTLHELTDKVDGGGVIHQTSVNINKNDGIHENASRTVKDFCDSLPSILNKKLFNQPKLIGISQKTSGRIWTNSMWNPLTLKVIYELFEDKINKYCIENKKLKVPKLLSILK